MKIHTSLLDSKKKKISLKKAKDFIYSKSTVQSLYLLVELGIIIKEKKLRPLLMQHIRD